MFPKNTFLGAGLLLLTSIAWTPLAFGETPAEPNAAAGTTAGRQYTPPGYVFSADIPHDMVSHDVGAIGFQPFVDILAWDTFIALNWPVPEQIVQRGVPDRQNIIGGFVTSGGEGGKPKVSPTGPTVWETYKDTADIFLNPPVKPAPFNAGESIPPSCKPLAIASPQAARRTLWQNAKVSDVLRDFEQAFTMAPLIDQNGEKVWYEIKVNQAYYDYVVNNGFYDSRKQKGKVISFPASSNDTDTEGAVKVKAAWKIIGVAGSKQPDDTKKFYTTDALIFDPQTKQCSKQTVGLVGLHVTMKTKQLPQWMWATFEHVDNAPDVQDGKAAPVAGKQYNFYNPSCTACPLNTPPSKTQPNTPTQVGRLIPVASTSVAPNASYQAALKSLRADNVWQNYMLVDAQWGASPSPIGEPNQPKFLANTVMETYLQGAVVDQQAPHGCINCHGLANKTDLDFQLTGAFPHPPRFADSFFKAHGISLTPKQP
jgi:hypothetical protein